MDTQPLILFRKAESLAAILAISLSLAFTSLRTGSLAVRPSRAAFPGENGKIAFERYNYGPNRDQIALLAINPDGTEEIELAKNNTGVSYQYLTWSPDGEKIAYGEPVRILDVASGDTQLIATGAAHADWSPDGKKLVYAKVGTQGNVLVVRDLITNDETQITDTELGYWYPGDTCTRTQIDHHQLPSWQPGGDQIVFQRYRYISYWSNGSCISNYFYDLWIVSSGGGSLRQLTDAGVIEAGGGDQWHDHLADWSPDGAQIAFVRENGVTKKIALINPAGGDPIDLVSLNAGNGYCSYWLPEPAWSPDGEQIAYEKCLSPSGSLSWEIHVRQLDNGDDRVIYSHTGPPHSYGYLSWQPRLVTLDLVVNSTDDDHDNSPGDGDCDTGQDLPGGAAECTLRAAIEEANVVPGQDAITFDIPGGGVPVIEAPDGFSVTESVVIDATTQPGGGKVELSGSHSYGSNCGLAADPPQYGFNLVAGQSTIRGFVIHGYCDWAIRLQGPENILEGNYIGVDAAGQQALGNGGRPSSETNGGWDGGGILIESSGNRVGSSVHTYGVCDGACNLISGNDLAPAHTGDWSNQPTGIKIVSLDAHDNVILGNFIGTDITGLTIPSGAPRQVHGIRIESSGENVIGETDAGRRNLISGNESYGVLIHQGSFDNIVQGNYIGPDQSGTGVIAAVQQNGVRITDSESNQILDNVISGGFLPSQSDGPTGVLVENEASTGNVIQYNFIGTNNRANLGNEHGITIQNGSTDNILKNNEVAYGRHGINLLTGDNQVTENDIYDNEWGVFIGKPTTAATLFRNWISDNKVGIFIEGGVYNSEISSNAIYENDLGIWLEAPDIGEETSGIRITQNSIHDNHFSSGATPPASGLGIDLAPVLPNLNDTLDVDWGPNTLLNFPELNFAAITTQGDLRVGGNYHSILGEHPYRLEFFSSNACDLTGYGEGERYLGSVSVTTTGLSGGADFDAILERPFVSPGKYITATAIDEHGNTSEFSGCVETHVGTSLTASANSGATAIQVGSSSAFFIGDLIRINPGGANQEDNRVTGFGSLLLAAPLQYAHAAGEPVVILNIRLYLPMALR